MGGHYQVGNYETLDEVFEAWKAYIDEYVNFYHLWLVSGIITYDGNTELFNLSMRFSK
jgi:hypothetical protein